MLQRDDIVSQNLPKARTLYQKACIGGYTSACANFGLMQARGQGGPELPAEARETFSEACEEENALGCYLYSIALIDEAGGEADMFASQDAREKACELGYEKAC